MEQKKDYLDREALFREYNECLQSLENEDTKYYSTKDNTKLLINQPHDVAFDLLLMSYNYCSLELPEYFDFDPILKYVKQVIGDAKYEDCISTDPATIQNVNLEFLLNKDGKYGVRPYVLSNPFLYYFLCRDMTTEENWGIIRRCFDDFFSSGIKSYALPVLPVKVETFHKSTVILNWWRNVEQRSLELSLKYKYMFITDITNCYGSMDPIAIKSAFVRKNTSKYNEEGLELAESVAKYLKAMQRGRNMGIPQGSCLFDLIGEILLGYSDLLLKEAIEHNDIDFGEYEILRYRDDYKIFSNDKDKLEKLSYILQRVLESLGLRMNVQKTKLSNDIIEDSIKKDKLAYIYNTPIYMKGEKSVFPGLQKQLIFILMFSRDYCNSGQLKNLLSVFDRKVEAMLKKSKENECQVVASEDGKLSPEPVEESKTMRFVNSDLKKNAQVLIALLAQIAVENITVVNYSLRTISKILSIIESEEKRNEIIAMIYKKLKNLPNCIYTHLWLQNITHIVDAQNKSCPYDFPLCHLVMGEKADVWDVSWLKEKYVRGFDPRVVVNSESPGFGEPIIVFRERRLYDELQDVLDSIEDIPDEIIDQF